MHSLLRRWLPALVPLALATAVHAQVIEAASVPPAQAAADKAAFAEVGRALAEGFEDVQGMVVLQHGRVIYEFHRDGRPDAPRMVASVTKSMLSTLVGIAMGQGRIASMDQPVVALVPEWAGLNADPRAGAVTLRHLLTMTSGFEPVMRETTAREAWARQVRAQPGQVFAYDNAMVPLLVAILEKVTGTPVADYARRELAEPLGAGAFEPRRGLRMRTIDMARVGQLFLQKGRWGGRQIVPESYVDTATRPQNAGGPPVFLAYGLGWWVVPPPKADRQTYMAAGFGGQLIWVHEPSDLVVAVHSTVSLASGRRGEAMQLIRGPVFAAVRKRAVP